MKTTKIPATAIVHTRNADRYLQEVLDCLQDFDELMVVDMESTDKTLAIAEANGCRIEKFPPCGYVEPARGFAMKAARNSWVFFVDADEIVPPELSRWIRNFVASPGEAKGVLVPRRNFFLGRWMRASYPDYQLRLLNRDFAEWPPQVHSRPEVKGEVIRIPKSFEELAFIHKSPSMEEVVERQNRYTNKEVERRPPRKVTLFTLWFRPWRRFFKAYILKGGFREGLAGYISARNDAIYQHYILSKQFEQGLNGRPRSEVVVQNAD